MPGASLETPPDGSHQAYIAAPSESWGGGGGQVATSVVPPRHFCCATASGHAGVGAADRASLLQVMRPPGTGVCSLRLYCEHLSLVEDDGLSSCSCN